MATQVTSLSAPRRLTGARRTADVAYLYLAAAFVVAVLVQVFLAGRGVFGIDALELDEAKSFDAHRLWGFALAGISAVLLVLALVARESRRTMAAALVLFLLVFVAQSVLAHAGEDEAWLGGLHALDGIMILLLSVWMTLTAWRRQHAT
jgi:hypothetical protein